MIEAFWSRMQVELLDRQSRRTRIEVANAIFEYARPRRLPGRRLRQRRVVACGWSRTVRGTPSRSSTNNAR